MWNKNGLAIVVATLLLIPSAAARAQENQVINPGFEDPIDAGNRWHLSAIGGALLDRSDSEAHSGTWSASVTNRAAEWDSVRYDIWSDRLIEDGGMYEMSMWLKVESAAPQSVQLNLQIDDDRVDEDCDTPPPGFNYCYCYDLNPPNVSCIYNMDTQMADSSGWVHLSWQGTVEIMGEPTFAEFWVSTAFGEPFSDLYVDDAVFLNLAQIFDDGFESGDTSDWSSVVP